MKRDFGYTFVNVFDTVISAQFLGFDKVGLADLIRRFFGHTIDKVSAARLVEAPAL